MSAFEPAKRVTVYICESDRHHHQSLAHAILERAREEGLSGATMLRGIEGFGLSGRLRTTRLLSSSDDLPVVVEIVDQAHRIETFLPILERLVGEGLITVEDVEARAQDRARPPVLDDPADGDPT